MAVSALPGSPLGSVLAAMQGSPTECTRLLLRSLCELLGMDVAYLTRLTHDGRRAVVVAINREGVDVEGAVSGPESLEGTWCDAVLRQGTHLVADVRTAPSFLALPSTQKWGIACHAGAAVVGDAGELLGTICVLGHQPHSSLNPRDAYVLRVAARAVRQWLSAWPIQPSSQLASQIPVQRDEADLGRLVRTLGSTGGLEELTRPLLETLHELTQLASTYLTVIHDEEQTQEIRFALNAREGFAIPEGLFVPWTDTLCKRALDEGRVCTTDVPEVWGDCDAAAALGIQVYVSVPVELSNGQLWGTLCAADAQASDDLEGHVATMRLFSRLIATEVERAETLRVLGLRAAAAETDDLTGAASRSVVEPWLDDAFARLPEDHVVVVGYVDVDGFKAINDAHGHGTGDAVLIRIAQLLRTASRPMDLIARRGGDEFVVASVVPRDAALVVVERLRDVGDLTHVVHDDPALTVRLSIGVVVLSHGPAKPGLEAADAAMYVTKRSRIPSP